MIAEIMEMIDDKILGFIYKQAMLDATRQTMAASAKNALLNNSEIENSVKEYAGGIMYDEISKISFEDASRKFYAIKLIGNEETQNFTFGNYQKLLNVTMKYLYIASLGNSELKENFKICHCPMDREMIQKVWKFYKARNGENQDNELLYYVYNGEKSNDYSRIAWSKISYREDAEITINNGCKIIGKKVYDNFQKMVRQLASDLGIMPIEFDYLCWRDELGELKKLAQEKNVSWKNEV